MKALVEAGGDFDKAIDILRKKDKISAARSNRETSEGVVIYKLSPMKIKHLYYHLLETDFVAKNEDFQELASKILDTAFDNNLSSVEEILSSSLGSSTIEQETPT